MEAKDPLTQHFRILPAQQKALKKLGVETVEDLLYHFPRSYGDTAEVVSIDKLEKGQFAVIFGKITGLKTKKAWRRKIPMAEASVTDDSGSVKIVWFHQAYLAKMIGEGTHVRVEGKVSEKNGNFSFLNPKIESAPDLFNQKSQHSLYPVYPETRGVTSNWIYHKVQNIFMSKGTFDTLVDPIPENILKKYNLPDLKKALVYLHTPQKLEHAEIARKRFAFEEIFFIQLEKQRSRHESQEKAAYSVTKSFEDVEKFIKRFPFSATKAQENSIKKILEDFQRGYPMSRLLEGDVGSGKTAVAATATYAVATSKPKDQNFGTLQTAYMAPTEILARQHFDSFITYFKHLPINIALITGSGCRKFPSKVNPNGSTEISRTQLLKWVASGEIAVLIGTHALIQKSVKFKHLALAIVDEQHRFGTAQRQKLVNKHEIIPHLLSMTATPIPRTLALTLYGDLDLTLLDEMPAGRKRIVTNIVTPANRNVAYQEIKQELKAGRQLYVICPRIDPAQTDAELTQTNAEKSSAISASIPRSSAIEAKSVKKEAERLKKEIFPEYRIEILHSKMPARQSGGGTPNKDQVMADFKAHKIDILVSTSVVEVGVNVENASLIIIEGAERFGLAQLHQLRGRVLRGTHQPYCYVFSENKSDKTLERLHALTTAKNGFELAEFDLSQRGAGALAGTKQWGISDLGMEAIKNLKMVEAARTEAQKLVEADPLFSKYPTIKERLENQSAKIHFE